MNAQTGIVETKVSGIEPIIFGSKYCVSKVQLVHAHMGKADGRLWWIFCISWPYHCAVAHLQSPFAVLTERSILDQEITCSSDIAVKYCKCE